MSAEAVALPALGDTSPGLQVPLAGDEVVVARDISKRLYIYSKDEPHPALVAVEADYSVNEVIESFLDFLKLDDDPETCYLTLKINGARVFDLKDLRDGEELEIHIAELALPADEISIEHVRPGRGRKTAPMRWRDLKEARRRKLHRIRALLFTDSSSSESSSDHEEGDNGEPFSYSGDGDSIPIVAPLHARTTSIMGGLKRKRDDPVPLDVSRSGEAPPRLDSSGTAFHLPVGFGKTTVAVHVPENLSPAGREIMEYFKTIGFFSVARAASFMILSSVPDSTMTPSAITAEAKKQGLVWKSFASGNIKNILRKEVADFETKGKTPECFFQTTGEEFGLSNRARKLVAAAFDLDQIERSFMAAIQSNRPPDELLDSGQFGRSTPKKPRLEEKEEKELDDMEEEVPTPRLRASVGTPPNERAAAAPSGRATLTNSEKKKLKKLIPSSYPSPVPLKLGPAFDKEAAELKDPARPRLVPGVSPLKEYKAAMKVKEKERELAERAALPQQSHLELVKEQVQSEYERWEAEATVAIDGVPSQWDGDGARQRIVKALASAFGVNVRRLQNPRFSNWWLLTLTSKHEAEAIANATFEVEWGKAQNKRVYSLKIIGLWTDSPSTEKV